MAVPFGLSTTFIYSLTDGQSVTVLWGWVFVSIISICIAASLGEICAVYPTAGGVYYWSAMLSTKEYAPVVSWYENAFPIHEDNSEFLWFWKMLVSRKKLEFLFSKAIGRARLSQVIYINNQFNKANIKTLGLPDGLHLSVCWFLVRKSQSSTSYSQLCPTPLAYTC